MYICIYNYYYSHEYDQRNTKEKRLSQKKFDYSCYHSYDLFLQCDDNNLNIYEIDGIMDVFFKIFFLSKTILI